MTLPTDPWFPHAPAQDGVLVVCFPFAGGSAAFFKPWIAPARELGLALMPVELPGRGLRLGEPALRGTEAVAEALGPVLRARLDRPWVLFGHSLGALLAFEVARHLRRRYALDPTLLVVSGRHPPHGVRDPAGFRHALPLPQLARALAGLNGTAPEVLAHEELLDLLAPSLRADFATTELYAHAPEAPLGCPVLALAGADDPEVSPEEMAEWARHGAGGFRLSVLPGDHFYLRGQSRRVLEELGRSLAPALRSHANPVPMPA